MPPSLLPHATTQLACRRHQSTLETSPSLLTAQPLRSHAYIDPNPATRPASARTPGPLPLVCVLRSKLRLVGGNCGGRDWFMLSGEVL
ncbi:hypothetical protein DEO72_LG1g3067 [Vigna unguiculata]|uniref:Uncharacterized protein n=1 Tax=Vigna unguiculata TaxID=3917 RepID=A0A4D6KMV0_VIGUN|nr:hypothetical protein DEO72_LG1g3067 [Vigna unguiculata]